MNFGIFSLDRRRKVAKICIRMRKVSFGATASNQSRSGREPKRESGRIERDQAFISHSTADHRWLSRLRMVLEPYIAKGLIKVWEDAVIRPGELWPAKIEEALERSRVGVLLTSPRLLASKVIREVELPALRRAARKGELTLFCIPIVSADPDVLDLRPYQWARPPEQPLDLLRRPEREQALVEIVKDLVAVFNSQPVKPRQGQRAKYA